MNREELRQAVVDNTGRSDKEDLINRAINFALEEMGTIHDFRDLIVVDSSLSISDGDSHVDLPTRTHNLLSARILGTNGYHLTLKTPQWVKERYPDPSEAPEGKPFVGYQEGQELHFVPESDGDYDLSVTVTRLPKLEADADDQPIRGGDRCVVAYASSYLFESIEKHEEARMWERRFQQALVSLIRADKRGGESRTFHTPPPELSNRPTEYWKDPFTKRMP